MAETTAANGAADSPLPARADASARDEIGERCETVRAGGVGAGFPSIHRVSRQRLYGAHGRVAIVATARTPFSRSGTDLDALDVIDLAGVAAAEAVARSGADPAEIDLAVFGCVLPALDGPNLGREAVLRAALPASIPGWAVNLACASSNRAITSAAEAILSGEAEVVLAGGEPVHARVVGVVHVVGDRVEAGESLPGACVAAGRAQNVVEIQHRAEHFGITVQHFARERDLDVWRG